MKRVVALVTGAFLLTSGTAFAHAGGKHHTDDRMAKLHKMMPRYAEAKARIDTALDKGELAAIARETTYLLSTTADLRKSKPHKQRGNLEEFKKLAADFEKDVKSTAESARKGDIQRARASFKSAQESCNACHAKFRD